MDEQIFGLSMQDCAEIMAKESTLRAQFGEVEGKAQHLQFLRSKGIDENTWAQAWNGWWTRMQADPSGQLHARFNTLQSQLATAAHFGDVRDMSHDQMEGVTLDTYARIMATISQGNAPGPLLVAEGIDEARWARVQKAWNDAMGADTSLRLTTQYGQLYAKHSPNHQAKMEAQVAAIMSESYAERAGGVSDEPEVEYTREMMIAEMQSSKPRERWSAAHLLCNEWDIAEDRSALQGPLLRAMELHAECLERHDEFTASWAETAARDFGMLAGEGALTQAQASDAQDAMARCRNRAAEALVTLQAAFAPIADKAVPERHGLQTQIQEHRSLLEGLDEVLGEWAPASASASGGNEALAAEGASAGLLGFLRGLPFVGLVLRLLGL